MQVWCILEGVDSMGGEFVSGVCGVYMGAAIEGLARERPRAEKR